MSGEARTVEVPESVRAVVRMAIRAEAARFEASVDDLVYGGMRHHAITHEHRDIARELRGVAERLK